MLPLIRMAWVTTGSIVLAASAHATPAQDNRAAIEAVLAKNRATGARIHSLAYSVKETAISGGGVASRAASVVMAGPCFWFESTYPTVNGAGVASFTTVRASKGDRYAGIWPIVQRTVYGHANTATGALTARARQDMALREPQDVIAMCYWMDNGKSSFLSTSSTWRWDSSTPPKMTTRQVNGATLYDIEVQIGTPAAPAVNTLTLDASKGFAVTATRAVISGRPCVSSNLALVDVGDGLWLPSKITSVVGFMPSSMATVSDVEVTQVNQPVSPTQFTWESLGLTPECDVALQTLAGPIEQKSVVDGELVAFRTPSDNDELLPRVARASRLPTLKTVAIVGVSFLATVGVLTIVLRYAIAFVRKA